MTLVTIKGQAAMRYAGLLSEQDVARIILAGAVAELLGGAPSEGSGDDFRHIERQIAEFARRDRKRASAFRRAFALRFVVADTVAAVLTLQQLMPHVDRVAAALLQDTTLEGDPLRAVLADVPVRTRPKDWDSAAIPTVAA